MDHAISRIPILPSSASKVSAASSTATKYVGSSLGFSYGANRDLADLSIAENSKSEAALIDSDSHEESRARRHRQTGYCSRVAFVPGAPQSDLYGAININSDGAKVAAGQSDATPHLRLKSGPTLLEIRRLIYELPNKEKNAFHWKHWKYQENNDEYDISQTCFQRQLFQHETVLMSRGIPGLGGNVSSTCLQFRPLSDEQQQNLLHFQQRQLHNDSQLELSPLVRCATGLTSGALCIHTISNLYDYVSSHQQYQPCGSIPQPSSTVAHYAPRQRRPATAVAWCSRNNNAKNSRLVAIGLVGTGGSSSSGTAFVKSALAGQSTAVTMSTLTARKTSSSGMVGNVTLMNNNSGGISPGGGGIGATGGDHDFGCLVWDIEAQSSVVAGAGSSSAGGGKGTTSAGGIGKGPGSSVAIKSPAYKYAHNSGVDSLAWLLDGQILAVGSQNQIIQLYDLRVSGTNAPPISIFAHTEAVSGIVPDLNCPTSSVFATFGKNPREPVKIWDVRMTDSPVGEIRVGPSYGNASSGVSAVSWSSRPGNLSIAIGNTIRTYDTKTPGSRAFPVEVSYIGGGNDVYVQDLAFQPQVFCCGSSASVGSKSTSDATLDFNKEQLETIVNPFEFYSHRMLVVSSRGELEALPELYVAPLAISNRDGRIAHGFSGNVSIGSSTEGPSAMEGNIAFAAEDVSARMMRRARCIHATRYSTDASANVQMLENERSQLLDQHQTSLLQNNKSSLSDFEESLSDIHQLLRLWRWISLVEDISLEQREGEDNLNSNNSSMNFSTSQNSYTFEESWSAKGLIDAGVLKLLRMSSRDVTEEGTNWIENKYTSDTLFCDVYDSPMRRASLIACGWVKRYGFVRNFSDDSEARGEFERSAALALWNGNLSECVAILQRGAENAREQMHDKSKNRFSDFYSFNKTSCEFYVETVNLIAICVAGFSMSVGPDGTPKISSVWGSACDSILYRIDVSLTEKSPRFEALQQGVSYLRAIGIFLLNIGRKEGLSKTINNEGLSLADRVGFACRFLSRADLRSFLDVCLRKCLKTGNLEGIVITGLDKRGIGLLQSYLDRSCDIQTAALVSSRVILPAEWIAERRVCSEWLDYYCVLLNNWQMWHSRAAFVVGKNEILRRLNSFTCPSSSRRSASTKKQQRIDNELSQSNFPPQLWARCNYCNSSLPLSKLRRQEGIVANSWLSRQKPMLTCCPQCKKPLPRCCICLLSLGCLNPYMELQRERNQYPRGSTQSVVEDLSGLATIPFAEWFTWCMRCKHGGHAHHLVGWFSKHSTCAVSGCDCCCQFDGIEKLRRPAWATEPGA